MASTPPLPASGYFTENAGQIANGGVRFSATSGGMQVGFSEGGVLYRIVRQASAVSASGAGSDGLRPEGPSSATSIVVRVAFPGSNRVAPVGQGELPFRSNFFLGDDPARWRTDVRNYREVVYGDLYPGIDLVYRDTAQGLKYAFVVRPGADLGAISLRYDYVDAMWASPKGVLARTPLGDIEDSAPVGDQAGRQVACSFTVRGPRSVGFDCPGRDASRTFLIDPLTYRIGYSTYLGGGNHEVGYSVAVDSSGKIYVTGYTDSLDFPAKLGFQMTNKGGRDAFVAKLNPAGGGQNDLVWATYLGGSADDEGRSIAVDASGNAYVTGFTMVPARRTPAFPTTTGAFRTSNAGLNDVFVTKLNPSGNLLVFSTLLGGSDNDYGYSIALDSASPPNPYVTGLTYSGGRTPFPTTGGKKGPDWPYKGLGDAFVTKVHGDGRSLDYSTFFGGPQLDAGYGIKVDGSGKAVLTGGTASSTGFPIASAYQPTYGGGSEDAFVAKVTPANGGASADLVYSTYLGGNDLDEARSIAVDASGNAYVAGFTKSVAPSFPTTANAYDTAQNGGTDAFVAELQGTGSTLLYSTFLGGGSDDMAYSLALVSPPDVYVAGTTTSTDFPLTPCTCGGALTGTSDAFAVRLRLAAQGVADLSFSAYVGGSSDETAYGVAADGASAIYLTGFTTSTDLPTTPGAFKTSLQGAQDAFVTVLSFPGAPCTPQNLVASSGKLRIDLSWQPPLSDGVPIDAYEVYRGTAPGGEGGTPYHEVIPPVTTWTDSGLTPGGAYYYQVSAKNSVGEGPRSNEACAMAYMLLSGEAVWGDCGHSLIRSVFAADLDNDGKKEIITVGDSNFAAPPNPRPQIAVWKWDGSNLVEKTVLNESNPGSFYGVYAADLGSNGTVEIVAVGDYVPGGPYSFGMMCVYTWDGTNLVPRPACVVEHMYFGGGYRAVTGANLNGLGNPELIISGFWNDNVGGSIVPEGFLHYFTYAGGKFPLGNEIIWTTTFGFPTVAYSVYAADVNGDATLEIVTGGSTNPGGQTAAVAHSQVIVWGPSRDPNGNPDWSTLVRLGEAEWNDPSNGAAEVFSVTAADVNQVAPVEILSCGYTHSISTGKDSGELQVFKLGASGLVQELTPSQKWLDADGNRCLSVTAGNLDNTGPIEIITSGYTYTGTTQSAEIKVWDFDASLTLTLRTTQQWLNFGGTPAVGAIANTVYAGDLLGNGAVEVVSGGQIKPAALWLAQLRIWTALV